MTDPRGLLLSACALELIFLRLRWSGDLSSVIGPTVLLMLLASTVYLLSVFLIQSAATPPIHWAWVLGPALLFRLTLWPVFPTLSDDPYRYRWEGKLQEAGGNPYQVRPHDAAWAHLIDPAFAGVVAKDFKAGYGPVLELLEWLNYRLTMHLPDPFAQVHWAKLPGALFDLACLPALALLLQSRQKPIHFLLVYAWCPLVIVEFWAMGHNDSVALFFVLLALWQAARERWWLAFALLTLAIATKLWPVILLPFFLGHRRHWWMRPQEWLAAFGVAGIVCWPYWSDVDENLRFLTGFMGGWRNNDSAYGLLFWLTGDPYRAKYLAFTLLGASLLVILLRRRWTLEQQCLAAIVGLLVLAANVHPWYLTWVVPLLAFEPAPWLMLWTSLVPVLYDVVIRWATLGIWEGARPTRWLVYVPVALLFLLSFLLKNARFRRPSN